jgi:effector-binding domain-containing protein
MPEAKVVIKTVPAVRAATLRDTIPSYAEQRELWEELMAHLKPHGLEYTGPCFTLYHEECHKEKDVDAEACQPVAGDFPQTARVKAREVAGAERMACLIHQGPYDGLHAAYGVLTNWIEANGYKVVGPDREVYHEGAWSTDDPAEYVTEIMVPVAKA